MLTMTAFYKYWTYVGSYYDKKTFPLPRHSYKGTGSSDVALNTVERWEAGEKKRGSGLPVDLIKNAPGHYITLNPIH